MSGAPGVGGGPGGRRGRLSGDPGSGDGRAGGGALALPAAKGAPWHFKLLVVGVTVYMIYRIYWLVEWLPKHI
jgi:hypothetical protein